MSVVTIHIRPEDRNDPDVVALLAALKVDLDLGSIDRLAGVRSTLVIDVEVGDRGGLLLESPRPKPTRAERRASE